MYIMGTSGMNTKNKSILTNLINNGLDAIRLNASHGTIKEFQDIVNYKNKNNYNIHILLDLAGAKIRVSDRLHTSLSINTGTKVLFCGEDVYDSYNKDAHSNLIVPLTIDNNSLITSPITSLSIKDGTLNFNIINISTRGILAISKNSGIIRETKGCNIPGLKRGNTPLSVNDKTILNWGLDNSVDIISQSFVEDPIDLLSLNNYIRSHSDLRPKILAKIETLIGFKNIDNILPECDGIIIGRGDLIPETSLLDAPYIEASIIAKTKSQNKDIFIATHLLDSMKKSSSPSLTEVECIYNYIKMNVDGFILCGETSFGKHPIKAVRVLKSLIERYQDNIEKQ